MHFPFAVPDYLGGVSLFDGWPFGPVVAFGTAAGEPSGLLRSGPLPAFMPSATLGLTMMCIAGLPFHGYVAMGPMAVNQVTPNQMRAQVSSVYLFTVNILGMGLGPALVPFISDHILHDPSKIRWGLLIVVASAGKIAAFLLWFERSVYRGKVVEASHLQ